MNHTAIITSSVLLHLDKDELLNICQDKYGVNVDFDMDKGQIWLYSDDEDTQNLIKECPEGGLMKVLEEIFPDIHISEVIVADGDQSFDDVILIGYKKN